MSQIHLNEGFNSFLVLWSNVTGDNSETPINVCPTPGSPGGYGAAGSWADSVYGAVAQQPWNISAMYSFSTLAYNQQTGQWSIVYQPVGAPGVSLGVLTSYGTPRAPGSTTPAVVLVPPIILRVQARDARY